MRFNGDHNETLSFNLKLTRWFDYEDSSEPEIQVNVIINQHLHYILQLEYNCNKRREDKRCAY